jgi:GntR family transcriptional regulator, rspAB operon transcriptional repressor
VNPSKGLFILLPTFEPIRENLGNQIFEHLRDQIYRMEILPGAPLGISDIADQLKVSRSPVRDAFLMLVQEGIVEPVSGGYRVIHFDRKYITDIFVVRRTLELTAVRLSVENLDHARVEQLRQIWENMRNAIESEPEFLERHLNADNELHQNIAEMSGNAFLKPLVGKVISLAALIRRWQYAGGASHQHLKSASEEHLKILDAMMSGDSDAAAAALDEHLMLAHTRSLARLDAASVSMQPAKKNARRKPGKKKTN